MRQTYHLVKTNTYFTVEMQRCWASAHSAMLGKFFLREFHALACGNSTPEMMVSTTSSEIYFSLFSGRLSLQLIKNQEHDFRKSSYWKERIDRCVLRY
jgi:hypothetical protein